MKVIIITEKRLEQLIEETRACLKARTAEVDDGHWRIARLLFGYTEIELHNLRRRIVEEQC